MTGLVMLRDGSRRRTEGPEWTGYVAAPAKGRLTLRPGRLSL